jgi:hypothetical protein
MVVMTAAAVACAVWVKLSVPIRVAIVAVPGAVLAWLLDAETILWSLLPPYGDPPKQKGPRYVIKWRRRGEKESRE